MKKFVFFLAFLLSLSVFSQTEKDTLSHTADYNGKDLFVKNPFDPQSSFVIKEVYLNEKIQRLETNQTVVQVKLSEARLKEGEEYTVKIVYVKGRNKPTILN